MKYVKKICQTRIDQFEIDHEQIDLHIYFKNHKHTEEASANMHKKLRSYQAEYAEILRDSVLHDRLTESTRKLLDQETPSKTFSKDLGACKPRMTFTEMYVPNPNGKGHLIK